MNDSKLNKKCKREHYITFISIALVALINTNNNPYSLIERIFKPIYIQSTKTAIRYAGFIVIALIFIGANGIKKSWRDTYPKRCKYINFFTIIIFLYISISLMGTSIKICKSFNNDLKSIFCYREDKKIEITPIDNNRVQFLCNIPLENCSNNKQQFRIKIFLHDRLKQYIDDKEIIEAGNFSNGSIITLQPKEKRNIHFTYITDLYRKPNASNFQAVVDIFEFSLYNDKQEVFFTEKEADIQMDNNF
jgi:hypothetical protein